MGRRASPVPHHPRRRERRTAAPSAELVRSLIPSVAMHQTLERLAYQDIRRAIVEGRLAPGQRIVPNAIAAGAGISRIPVLQALRRLESEGFVRISPHKEVVVASLSPEETRERFLLMGALERLCLRESVGKITPALVTRLRALQKEMIAAKAAGDAARAVAADGKFHRELWETSGLRQVGHILQNLWDRGEYYRMLMHGRRGGFASESLAEHQEILKAVEQNDLARAAKAIETHRLRALERLGETA